MIALRSFVGARENCRRYDVELPRGFDERLSQRVRLRAAHAAPRRHDPRALRQRHRRLRGAARAGRAAARARRAAPPPGRPASFEDGGYFVQRAGDRYLIFDCGPLGDGGHGHYDALSIEAWAGDRALVLDPGRFTYAEGEPNLRHWFRGTAAHNTVTVDGTDQTPYARSRSSLPSAEATFLGRETRDGLDILCGEVRSPVYEAVHRRRVIFVDGAYWVIEDVLTGERRHRYDLRFHLAPARLRRRRHADVTGARGIALRGRAGSRRVRDQRSPRRSISAVAIGRARALRHAARAGRARAASATATRCAIGERHARARRAGDAAMIARPRRPPPRRAAAPRDDGRRDLAAPARRRPRRALRAHLRQVPLRRQPARRLPLRRAATSPLRTGKRDGIAAPEVGAALYPFPHDRKLDRAARRARGDRAAARRSRHAAARRLRRRAVRHLRLPRRPRHRGRLRQGPAGDAEHRACRALAGQDAVRVPRVLAAADGVAAARAARTAAASTTPRDRRLHALGAALRRACTPSTGAIDGAPGRLSGDALGPSRRLELERLATAADVIARARPDVAPRRASGCWRC